MYNPQPLTNLRPDLLLLLWHSLQHLHSSLDPLVDDVEVVEGLGPQGQSFLGVCVHLVLVVVDGVQAIFLLGLNVVLQGLQDVQGLHNQAISQ